MTQSADLIMVVVYDMADARDDQHACCIEHRKVKQRNRDVRLVSKNFERVTSMLNVESAVYVNKPINIS